MAQPTILTHGICSKNILIPFFFLVQTIVSRPTFQLQYRDRSIIFSYHNQGLFYPKQDHFPDPAKASDDYRLERRKIENSECCWFIVKCMHDCNSSKNDRELFEGFLPRIPLTSPVMLVNSS